MTCRLENRRKPIKFIAKSAAIAERCAEQNNLKRHEWSYMYDMRHTRGMRPEHAEIWVVGDCDNHPLLVELFVRQFKLSDFVFKDIHD